MMIKEGLGRRRGSYSGRILASVMGALIHAREVESKSGLKYRQGHWRMHLNFCIWTSNISLLYVLRNQ